MYFEERNSRQDKSKLSKVKVKYKSKGIKVK